MIINRTQDRVSYNEVNIHDSNKEIENQQILISAFSGHGKSWLIERIIQEYHEAGCLVIVLTEKFIKNFEICMMQFPPEKPTHLNILNSIIDATRRQALKPITIPTQIYHPTTIPTHQHKYKELTTEKLPPINWFTIPLKSLTIEDLNMMMESDPEKPSEAVKLTQSTIQELNNNNDLFDLNLKIQEKVFITKKKEKKTVNINPNKKIPTITDLGKQTTAETIQTNLETLFDDYFISNNNPTNINWKKILTNHKQIHIFSYWYLNHTKNKYFITNYLINQIFQHSHHIKKPVLLVIQEANAFLNKGKEQYITITAQNLSQKLKQMRNVAKGFSSVADAQSPTQIHEDYSMFTTTNIIGRISTQDIYTLNKTYAWNPTTREEISTLKKGSFIILGEREPEILSSLPPQFQHAETGTDYYETYKQHHPTKLQNYSEIIKQKEQEIEQRKKETTIQLKKALESLQKEQTKKPTSDITKSTVKKIIKTQDKEAKKTLQKICFDKKETNPNLKWQQLAEQVKEEFPQLIEKVAPQFSYKTAQRYYESHRQKQDK